MLAHSSPQLLHVLVTDGLSRSAKLVWMLLQIDGGLPTKQRLSPTRIQRCTGLSRPTIRTSLAKLVETGLLDSSETQQRAVQGQAVQGHTVPEQADGAQADLARTNFESDRPNDQRNKKTNPIERWIPRGLITNHKIPVQARLVYLALRAWAKLQKSLGDCSYAGLAKQAHLQPRTVRKAMFALEESGWLAFLQTNQRAPIRIFFPDPADSRSRADIMRAKQRLRKNKHIGECLTLLFADTMVDSDTFVDDAFPQGLTNPTTSRLLQIDREYTDKNVGIEFNGPQHDGPTARYSAEEAKAQMERDRVKREILARRNYKLLTIRPEDLTFERMKAILGSALPLRDVRADDPLIVFLEAESRKYRAAIRKIRSQAEAIARNSSNTSSVQSPPVH